jgi:hypothetical protein
MASVMAAPASAGWDGPRGPQVVSNWLQRVDAGEAETVSVWFRGTDRRICDFKMVVRDTRQVDVSYPRHRRFATLKTGSTLVRGERDRATFRVEADARRGGNAFLSATVFYNDCGRHSRTEIKRFGLLLPIDGGFGHHGNGGGGNGHDDNKGGWGKGTGHDDNKGGWGKGTGHDDNKGGWDKGTGHDDNKGGSGSGHSTGGSKGYASAL